MPFFRKWSYPNIPDNIQTILSQNEQNLIIIGVIGKSSFSDCNKMLLFNLNEQMKNSKQETPEEGEIEFYFRDGDNTLFLHFLTTYDEACMEKYLSKLYEENKDENFTKIQQQIFSRFARMLLFATQVCHLIVMVEVGQTFDASYLSLFKSLRIIREKHLLKFLPKIIKNSSIGAVLGKQARICTPRFIFAFETYPNGYDNDEASVSQLEFEVEDNIYKMLRNDFIITNNCAMSLFSIPSNKRFVFYKSGTNLREDRLLKAFDVLNEEIEKKKYTDETLDDIDDLLPYRGFGRPLIDYTKDGEDEYEVSIEDEAETDEIDSVDIGTETKVEGETTSTSSPSPQSSLSVTSIPSRSESPMIYPDLEEEYNFDELIDNSRNLMHFLKDHIDEALSIGFDDNSSKYKGASQFLIMPFKAWYDIFKLLHKLLIENPDSPDFEAKDADYKSYLENFNQTMSFDDDFFEACCKAGYKSAFAYYNNPVLAHYSASAHEDLLTKTLEMYEDYARGPKAKTYADELRNVCEEIWRNGKQQCETPSLAGNPCVLAKHNVEDPSEHSSGNIYISTCNCGRLQGRRDDPYTLRQANYEFYEFMARNCTHCLKVKRIDFDIFKPTISNFRAVEMKYKPTFKDEDDSFPLIVSVDTYDSKALSQPFAALDGAHENLSLSNSGNLVNLFSEQDDKNTISSEDSLNELVLQVNDDKTIETHQNDEYNLNRQASTTEYLPAMVHTQTPNGLLPQFSSWSLVCIGPSAIYSHSTGLLEHFQSGFLSGSNFLLPWDVQVRLEHSRAWLNERGRYRRIGDAFILKIFVGFEYECLRGHRFMMSAPDKILRSSAGILRDSGSKVVYNNMPLYYPCPCHHARKGEAGQLMRVHVVTPKAPVNVILDPKIRTGNREYLFTLGLSTPPKLTQSAYWLLRLPYIYQGDDEPIQPPRVLTTENAISFGYIAAGMFGVTETEMED